MVTDDVLDDGQPQPGAACGARSRRVGPVEPLEDPALVVAVDADALVRDRDLDGLTPAVYAESDL